MKTKRLVMLAVCSALTAVTTLFLRIPLSGGGYLHLGDTVLVFSAGLFGGMGGMLVGMIGSSLADLLVSPVWIPATLLVKGIMGLLIAASYKKRRRTAVLYMVLAGVVMTGGYYLAECLLYGNFTAPLFSLPWNAIQYIVSLLLGTLLCRAVSSKLPRS